MENEIKLVLTAWDIHLLLGELEHQLRVVNKDNRNTTYLYNKIADQLETVKVGVSISDAKVNGEKP